jgi:D-lactate dehydrogenase (cytochrome)
MLGPALPVSRLEFADAASMAAVNGFRGTRYPESPALFIDLEAASDAAAASDEREVREVCTEYGASELAAARTHTERHALWEDRHQLFFALEARSPGHRFLVTDTAVPYSRIADGVAAATRLGGELGLDICVDGHIGDGNVHVVVPYSDASHPLARQFSDAMVRHALSVGGTATGEHGIGLTQKEYLCYEQTHPRSRWTAQSGQDPGPVSSGSQRPASATGSAGGAGTTTAGIGPSLGRPCWA